MEIVIDIPENYYKDLMSLELNENEHLSYEMDMIRHGTLLPKRHGRLIDMKKLQKFVSDYTEHDAVQLILADREDYLPTIIEANKESEDE